MKVREFKQIIDKNELEVDVYDNYVDEIGICYVGDCDTEITAYGEEYFKKVLYMDIIWDGGNNATLDFNNVSEDEVEGLFKLAKKFFYGLAGYMGVNEYKQYFIEIDFVV